MNAVIEKFRSTPVPLLVVFLAFSLSTVSTGWGLAVGLQETSDLSVWTTAAVGGALSLLISLVGYLIWTTVGRISRGFALIVVILILPVGFAITGISTVFAGAGMIYATNINQLQRGLEAKAIAQVTQPLDSFRLNLARIAEGMEDVAGVAASQAAIESASGGSCLHSVPIVGEGPIYRWRLQANADAETLSTLARALQTRADTIVSAVYAMENIAVTKQAALTRAYQEARQLDASTKVSRIQRWVSPIRSQLEQGRINFEGKVRDCSDPALLAMIVELDETLGLTILNLPALPPEIVTPSIFHAMIENAKTLASLNFSASSVNDNIDTEAFSMLPITIIAIIIDLVGLISAVIAGRMPPKFAYHEVEYKQRLRWLANALRWDTGERGTYFCVPIDGDLQVEIEANNVAISFGLKRIPTMMGISIEQIAEVSEWESGRLNRVSGGATRFKVYEFNRVLNDELVQIETRLRFDSQFNYQSAPSQQNVQDIDEFRKRIVDRQHL